MHQILRKLQNRLANVLPRAWIPTLRILRHPSEISAAASFLGDPAVRLPVGTKLDLLRRLHLVSRRVESPHRQAEILSFMRTILTLPRSVEGVVVEAGCYKGSSTAKFSLAAALSGRELVVFDSFQGLPDNRELHGRDIFGGTANFRAGEYCGSLDEVRKNVSDLGRIDACRFVEGWFDETLPGFRQPVAAAYLDVDLVRSTRTCLKHLYPRLAPGGVLFSQDGHLPLVIELLRDETFWREEVGCRPPAIEGLGRRKLVRIVKET